MKLNMKQQTTKTKQKLMSVGTISREKTATPTEDIIAAVILTKKAIDPGLVVFLTIQTYNLRL